MRQCTILRYRMIRFRPPRKSAAPPRRLTSIPGRTVSDATPLIQKVGSSRPDFLAVVQIHGRSFVLGREVCRIAGTECVAGRA
jgi:hypothetical protein